MTTFISPATQLFGIKHPVILAPMGGVSGGKLAAAVSRAGGLGLVGASYGDPEWMKTELGLMADVEEPWGIGLVMFTVAKRFELLDLALSYRPRVVALSFGDPKPFVPRIKEHGALAIVQVHDVDQALVAIEAGADALIVQGVEAGGHNLERATLPLIPAVRDAVGEEFPLIATGGIADGRGFAAVLALGANAVMMGTRFLATDEALPSARVKQRVLESRAKDTVRTRAFDIVRDIDWPESYSARALSNSFTHTWVGRETELMHATRAVRDEYMEGLRSDNIHVRAIFAGEVLDLIHDVFPARAIVENIIRDAEKELSRASRNFSSRP